MKKNWTIRLLAGVAAGAMAFSMVGCGSSKDNSKNGGKEKFIVGFDAAFPPYGYQDENGEYVGFDLDLAAEVCKRNDWELVKQPIDWNAKDMELNSGTISCIWNGFTMSEEMKTQVLFTDPYVKNRQIIVVGADSDINTKADLKDKVVGVQAGSSANEAIDNEADVLSAEQYAVGFAKNNTELRDKVQKTLDEMREDGKFAEIAEKWDLTDSVID